MKLKRGLGARSIYATQEASPCFKSARHTFDFIQNENFPYFPDLFAAALRKIYKKNSEINNFWIE